MLSYTEIGKMPMSTEETGIEKGETETEQKHPPQPQSGLSQSSKDDIGVCVVIISITLLAIIVTIIKIILFDLSNYPELFGYPETTNSTD